MRNLRLWAIKFIRRESKRRVIGLEETDEDKSWTVCVIVCVFVRLCVNDGVYPYENQPCFYYSNHSLTVVLNVVKLWLTHLYCSKSVANIHKSTVCICDIIKAEAVL